MNLIWKHICVHMLEHATKEQHGTIIFRCTSKARAELPRMFMGPVADVNTGFQGHFLGSIRSPLQFLTCCCWKCRPAGLSLSCAAALLPHPEKLKTGGEDAYFISDDHLKFGGPLDA